MEKKIITIENMDAEQRTLGGYARRIKEHGFDSEFQTVADIRALCDDNLDNIVRSRNANERITII